MHGAAAQYGGAHQGEVWGGVPGHQHHQMHQQQQQQQQVAQHYGQGEEGLDYQHAYALPEQVQKQVHPAAVAGGGRGGYLEGQRVAAAQQQQQQQRWEPYTQMDKDVSAIQQCFSASFELVHGHVPPSACVAEVSFARETDNHV